MHCAEVENKKYISQLKTKDLVILFCEITGRQMQQCYHLSENSNYILMSDGNYNEISLNHDYFISYNFQNIPRPKNDHVYVKFMQEKFGEEFVKEYVNFHAGVFTCEEELAIAKENAAAMLEELENQISGKE